LAGSLSIAFSTGSDGRQVLVGASRNAITPFYMALRFAVGPVPPHVGLRLPC